MTETEKQNEQVEEVECKECQEAQAVSKKMPDWASLPMVVLAGCAWAALIRWVIVERDPGLISLYFLLAVFASAFSFFALKEFVRGSLLGVPFFFFVDEGGQRHIHTKPPSLDFQRNHQVLKIWYGGWFRKPEVLGRGSIGWKISRTKIDSTDLIEIWRVTIQDRWGNEITRHPWQLLPIIDRFTSVEAMFRTYEERENLLDELGVSLLAAIKKIYDNKQRHGRSKGVQEIREGLENIFNADEPQIPMALQLKWKHRVAQLEMEPREPESPEVQAQA